ncbi:restriction endonuclease subunit S [Vibrio cholerae]|nr:restriction endonuclease subunit S [Vibrio cholerae]
MVRCTDVKYGKLDLKSTFKVNEEVFKEFSRRYTPSKGDIIITRVGSYGITAIVDELDFCLGQNTSVIIPKNINARYLYLALNSTYVKNQIEFSVVGSTQKTLSLKAINNLEIPRFEPNIEDEIAKIGGELDDKIELNAQTNQTLEQIAQAIFKSWFVDFDPVKAKIEALATGGSTDDAELAAMSVISAKTVDELNSLKASNPEAFNKLAQTAALFPAAMQDSELGEIPEGWEVKSLGEFTSTFDYVANGSFAALKANVKLFDEPNDVLYVRTTDFNKGFKSELKYTDNSSYQFLAKSKLFGHETIISNVGDVGTVFRAPSWYGMPMTLGSNAMGIVAEGANSYIYYLFKSPLGQHLLDGITSGSAQMKFNKTSFRKLRVVLPNSVLLIKFEEFEASLWTKHTSNQKESLHLENLRDSLLPKLLSGEIDLTSEVVE